MYHYNLIAGRRKRNSKKPNEEDTASTGSSISTKYLQQIVDKLKHKNIRESTDRVYYQIWKQFNQFFIKLDIKPRSWEDRIVLFVGYLIQKNRKSNMIKSYISAIRSVLAKDGVELNEDKFLLTSLTKACRLKNDRVCTSLPIRHGLMKLLLKALEKFFSTPQPYLVCLYKTMISTAYYGLFRIGEISFSPHVVKAADVHIGDNKDKMLFVLHMSKTHGRESKPQIIKISATKTRPEEKINNLFSHLTKCEQQRWCPFQILRDYVKLRKKFIDKQEPFFVFRDRTPVKPAQFRKVLKKLIKKNGLNPGLYRGHSLRGGCATDMAELQISLESIRKIGKWKSSAIYTYLRT